MENVLLYLLLSLGVVNTNIQQPKKVEIIYLKDGMIEEILYMKYSYELTHKRFGYDVNFKAEYLGFTECDTTIFFKVNVDEQGYLKDFKLLKKVDFNTDTELWEYDTSRN